MAWPLATYAYRNIRRTRLRSGVTLVSVALVVMLYSVLTSVGRSVADQVGQALVRQQIDVVVQSRYAATPVASSLPRSVIDQIASLPQVRDIDGLTIDRRRVDGDATVFLLGASRFAEFAGRLGMGIVRGRAHRPGSTELVIGERTARALELGVGDRLDLGAGPWEIVGVYSTWLDFLNAGVVADLAAAQRLAERPDRVNILFVSLTDPAAASQVSEQIVRSFPGLWATTSQRLPDFIGPLRTMLSFSRVATGVTLVVVFGLVLNTLVMSIGERTSEIGILGAMGWSRSMIVAALVIEAVIVAVAGAALGFGLAIPALRVLQQQFTSVYMYVPSYPRLAVLPEVLGLGAFAGAASALFPALYGTRLGPAAAIRHG